VLLCSLAVLVLAAAPKTTQQLFDDARASYARKDYPGYLEAMEALATLRPQHPLLVGGYAGALALNDRGQESVAQLQRLLAMHVAPDLDDHDLDGIREREDFRAFAGRVRTLRTTVVGAPAVAYRLPAGLITESITYDRKSDSFFVSSVRKRKILRIDGQGRIRDFVKSGEHGLWGANGMGVDAKRRILWASSTAYDRCEGFREGDAADPALYAFNADSGAFVARYEPPKEDGPHNFDDLSVSPDGSVYVSDSTGMVFTLRQGAHELLPLVRRGKMRSAQGSAVDSQHHLLYVSDYGSGIDAVDLATGDVARLALPADFPAYGIDGLALHGRTLIGVQNGVVPNRVVQIELTPDGFHVAAWRIVAMNQPLIDEPTIGVVARGAYFFLGASQGNKFDGRLPKAGELHEAPVYRLPL
jgi:sugar lactone lactonase YvrE